MSDTPRPKYEIGVTPPPRPMRKSDIIDVDGLYETVGKIASAVNRSALHIERIPEIQRKVETTSERVIELKTEVRGLGERVTRIEGKVDLGHTCQQAEIISEIKDSQRETSRKIETDIQKGIAQAGEIAVLRKESSVTLADVEDIKRAPRRLLYGIIGLVITTFTGLGSGIWFLAELSKDVEHERESRTEQISRVERQLTVIGQKVDTVPLPAVKQAITELAAEVERSNGHAHEYETLCDGFAEREKRRVGEALLRSGKRVPRSCR